MSPRPASLARPVRLVVQLLAALAVGSAPLAAQSAGVITGRVTGPDGQPLEAASVAVNGTSLATATDRDGLFRIALAPLGRQTVTIRSLGKKPAEQVVTVRAEQPVRLAVALELAATQLSGVSVIGERSGQIRSAEQKRRSATISDVTSADEIGLLPDQNVAEAVQRIPGIYMETSRGEGRTVSIRGVAPNLNNVTLNGQQMATTSSDRAQTLDLLPASMVANIEVIKAVTPDMDANTIGGTVNLKTLTAFDRPRPFFFGIAEGLVHNRQVPYGPRTQPYELDMTTGRRFGKDDTWGIVLSGSASRRDNAVSVLDPDGWIRVLNRSTNDSIDVSNEIELQVADNDRTRYSLTSSLDWRPRPETNLYLRGLYTRTTELERNSEFEITFTGNYEFPANARLGRNTASSMELDISRDDETENLYTLSLGGSQRWGRLTMDLNGVATRGEARSFGPDATFENPRATDPQAPVQLDFTRYFFGVTPENPGFVSNPTNYALNGLSFNRRFVLDNTFIGAADFRVDSRLGRFPTSFKFGAKVISRGRDIDDTSDRYLNPTGINLGPWSERVVGGLQGAASPFVQGAVDPFATWVNGNLGGATLPLDAVNTEIQKIDGDAYVTERISAGYLMGTTEFGRFTAVTGVRVERTDSDAEFWELFENSRLTGAARYQFPSARTTRANSYTNVLPAAIFKFDVTKNLLLRAAYTSTIARPQFTQLASFTRANYIPDPAVANAFDGTVTDNNPDLKPYTSGNTDVSLEYYPSTGGSLAVAYFHKNIDNPIYTFRSTERNVTYDGRFFTVLRYTQQRNGDAGSLGGVEMSWSQPLYFLPGVLNGFGINANVAFITSSLRIVGRNETLPFLGQPDQVINLIPYYQKGPFEVRFAYARRSSFLSAVTTPGFDRFTASRETMDLNVRWQLAGPKWEILATARNLTNAPEVGFQGNQSRYDLHVLTGRTFSLGLRTTR
ncbi:MAG: TonB-dependent receptor [Gemmatimonadaceae bacterium]|jgi:TonB-dependent receptor|nr:TonB-dependent receptor [Gemmatimonadaceae bacterium]